LELKTIIFEYGCHPSDLSHHALGMTECHESYCNEGGGDHIWSFFRQGAGNVFSMSHTATRASSGSWPNKVIPYMDFWKFKFFCDVSSGVETCPYMEYGRDIPLFGSATGFWVD